VAGAARDGPLVGVYGGVVVGVRGEPLVGVYRGVAGAARDGPLLGAYRGVVVGVAGEPLAGIYFDLAVGGDGGSAWSGPAVSVPPASPPGPVRPG
jgi:hypothetical protein